MDGNTDTILKATSLTYHRIYKKKKDFLLSRKLRVPFKSSFFRSLFLSHYFNYLIYMDVSLLFLRFSSLAVFSSHIFFFLPLSLLRSVPLCLPAVAAGLVSELRHGLGRRHHRRSARTSGPQPPVSAAAVAAWWQDRRRLHCHWPSEALDSSCPFWPSKCPAASPQLRL